ncbi:MAG: TrkH family potassium uptake protein [Desulfobacterales bacterium]|jgi:trk system potassium uptake protein TrkH
MGISKAIVRSPARTAIVAFALLIFTGTFLLMLPAASTGKPVGCIDALFTSTSAVCVTGLTVVDTGRTYSLFGQSIIMILIQIGGLGIMTMSTLFIMLAGKRPGLAGQIVVQDAFTHSRERHISSILKDVFLFTGVIEGVGILIMFFVFLPENSVQRAFFLSVFHSISAFCNAGFSVFSDSFVKYRENVALNLVICFLIISGGIGFLVLSEIKRKFLVKHRALSRLSLHSKIVLSTTLFLILSGMVLILGMEWSNTLAPLSLPGRFLAAFFQSVTARTAGFNTLPIGNMANQTLFLITLLMFIGASPGSCGGGIKTTSFATLAVLGLSRFQGQDRPLLFNRTISATSVGKAVSVVILSAMVICLGIMLLLITEIGQVSHTQSRGRFLELFFEVVSAFGTVGLSTGITGLLSEIGKVILSMVMFVGRLGPLVVGVAVSRDTATRYFYAEESIMVG